MRGEPETIAEGLQRRTGEVWGSSARVEVCHNTCAQSLNSWLLRVTLYSPLRTKYKDSEPHSLLLTNWVAKWRGIERDRGKETKGETEIAREGERRIRESEWVWWSDGFPRWASNIFFLLKLLFSMDDSNWLHCAWTLYSWSFLCIFAICKY